MSAKAQKARRSSDTNMLAKQVVDLATSSGEFGVASGREAKDPAAVALGRRGGLKGGKARAEKLPADERKRIAVMAAKARWKKNDDC